MMTTTPNRVTLTLADDAQLPIVHHMFVAYFYDLSQYDDNLIINDYGLPMWAPFGLPGPTTPAECVAMNWWVRDRCRCYVIRVDGSPAGFAIVRGAGTGLEPGVDWELQDFYIAPKYRRGGVGRLAAPQVFDLERGVWQVFQLARNLPARVFWQQVIGDYTAGNFQNIGDGTEQRFDNRRLGAR